MMVEMDKEAQKIAVYVAKFNGGLDFYSLEAHRQETYMEIGKEILKLIGYRKPPDRPELRKDIAKLKHDNLGCGSHNCPHWQKDCFNYDWVIHNGLCPEMLDQILALIPDKLPEGEPPLLSDERIMSLRQTTVNPYWLSTCLADDKVLAQAQIDLLKEKGYL